MHMCVHACVHLHKYIPMQSCLHSLTHIVFHALNAFMDRLFIHVHKDKLQVFLIHKCIDVDELMHS